MKSDLVECVRKYLPLGFKLIRHGYGRNVSYDVAQGENVIAKIPAGMDPIIEIRSNAGPDIHSFFEKFQRKLPSPITIVIEGRGETQGGGLPAMATAG